LQKLRNEEFNTLYSCQNIIRCTGIGARRIRWARHVADMGRQICTNILLGNLERICIRDPYGYMM
jgi:hypothetical protein